jgi:DNA-binding NtrC family response regulator
MLDASRSRMKTMATSTSGGYAIREATSIVVSRDAALVALVRRASPDPWLVESCGDWRRIDQALGNRRVHLAILDDEAVPEGNRSELIDKIHKWFPDALIIYVAGKHSQTVERSARASGVLCYTSKPVEVERLEHLLRSLSHRSIEPSDAPYSTSGSPSGPVPPLR